MEVMNCLTRTFIRYATSNFAWLFIPSLRPAPDQIIDYKRLLKIWARATMVLGLPFSLLFYVMVGVSILDLAVIFFLVALGTLPTYVLFLCIPWKIRAEALAAQGRELSDSPRSHKRGRAVAQSNLNSLFLIHRHCQFAKAKGGQTINVHLY